MSGMCKEASDGNNERCDRDLSYETLESGLDLKNLRYGVKLNYPMQVRGELADVEVSDMHA